MSVQGLQGLFTTMQGTIASLQSTVVALQHKQSGDSSTSTNQLDKFYNNLQQQNTIQTSVSQYGIPALNTVPAQNASTQHGVPVDSLPHIDVITDSLRKNITAGKYVNLATLLIPDMDTKVSENLGVLEFLKRQQKDHRLDRPLNTMQFYRAFGIYKLVMCEAYPQRRAELYLYGADIGDLYDHYGEVFYQYHVKFSKKAAAYMEKGIKVDWSKRHKDLFQLLVGGSKTKLCEHCFQADHQSPFCPTQINIVHSPKQRPVTGQNATTDRKGPPPRVLFKKNGHGQVSCLPGAGSFSEQSIATGTKNSQKPSE